MPRAIPIIGHLHLLGQYEVPYQAFKVISKTHGLIFRLKLGVVPAIVVNGLDNIKEVLFVKATDFDGRLNLSRYNDLFSGNRENSLAFCNFSNLQKLRREILQVHTFPRNFSSRFLKLDSIIHRELNQLKSNLKGDNPLPNFKVHLFQEMVRHYDSVFYEMNQGYASDFLPWLSYFQTKSHKKKLSLASKSIRAFVMEFLMNERIAKYNKKQTRGDNEEEDYVDSLLDSVHSSVDIDKVNMDLNTALFSLEDIVGGHTAISNFIMKTLGFLVNHPNVQAKIQEEVDAMTLNARPVTLADRKQMPYTEATILESIRMITSPIVPHVATQDSSIGGFEVQKDTMIFLNNYDLNMSPELWNNPDKFQPERFINTEGRIAKPEHFLPFSGGRRSCMGNKMVQLISFSTLASLLQSYDLNKLCGHNYKVRIGDLALPYETFQFEFKPRQCLNC
ncbi:hypothetical protein WDU94_004467 [Cyamophila willieti]